MRILTGLALVFITILTILNVFSRNFLHLSIAYTEEVAVGFFLWMTFLGIGLGIVEGLHVSVEVLIRRAGPKLTLCLRLLSLLCFVIFLVVLSVWGALMVHREWAFNQTTESLGWPMWVFGLSVPVGSVVGLIYTVRQAFIVMRGRKQ